MLWPVTLRIVAGFDFVVSTGRSFVAPAAVTVIGVAPAVYVDVVVALVGSSSGCHWPLFLVEGRQKGSG